ncbi:MAG: hypothetical protein JJE25_09745, partial [Bacteroidia bacterium]|nr:hypothetical protein [Bacteroidia bacterium]
MKNFYLIIFSAVLFLQKSYSQEMLGIANSNYAGLTGLSLNPASMVNGKIKVDINLITAGINFENNYFVIPKSKLTFFGFKNIADQIDNNAFLDNSSTSDKQMNMSSFANALSFLFSVKQNWFAFRFNVRSAASVSGLQYAISKFAYEGLDYAPLQNQEFSSGKIGINFLSWGEFALSYGRIISDKEKNFFKGGITLKKLNGFYGTFFKSDGLNFNVLNDSVLYVQNSSFSYGRSWIENNNGGGLNGITAGNGFGFDLGLIYEYRPDYEKYLYEVDGEKLENPRMNSYKLRAGISLIDFGQISFTKDASLHEFNIPNQRIWFGYDTAKFSTDNFDTTLSSVFLGDPYRSKTADKFKMALPTTVSVQLDYKFTEKIYANATWIQGLSGETPRPKAPSIISITPRYEISWFEVAAPLSYYQYDVFRIGLAFRLSSFIIGSDKIGSLMGISDMSGMDFYFALKFSLFKNRISDRDHDGVSDKRDKCPDT